MLSVYTCSFYTDTSGAYFNYSQLNTEPVHKQDWQNKSVIYVCLGAHSVVWRGKPKLCVCVCPSGEYLDKVSRWSFMMPTDKLLCQDKLWFVFNTHYSSLPCCFTIFEVPLFLSFHSSLACSLVKQMDPCSTFWRDQRLLPPFSLHLFQSLSLFQRLELWQESEKYRESIF